MWFGCSSPGWGSRCILAMVPWVAGNAFYCVSVGNTATTVSGGKCYDWFLWNAGVGM